MRIIQTHHEVEASEDSFKGAVSAGLEATHTAHTKRDRCNAVSNHPELVPKHLCYLSLSVYLCPLHLYYIGAMHKPQGSK
jgi:hypothetical protein